MLQTTPEVLTHPPTREPENQEDKVEEKSQKTQKRNVRSNGTKRVKLSTKKLWQHVGVLRDYSTVVVALAEVMPDRVTVSQAVFFLTAAIADIEGNPTTFSAIKEEAGEVIGKSLHTTYKVFLDEENVRKDRPTNKPGLGWLTRETNVKDNRKKVLRLTNAGEETILHILMSAKGLV